ncbi:MAG: histidine phosphatase family protein [Pseudomonadota bacterium]
MTGFSFALMRHGLTAWNLAKKLQGRSDIDLTDEARQDFRKLSLPASWQAVPWRCSPLRRTWQTAVALGITATPDPAWIEMDWGQWEGMTVAQLRQDMGPAMQENEDRGLDFRPDNGESPHDVLNRVTGFLRGWSGGDFGVVTHKGVIRAVYASAVGWDMTGRMPDKLDWQALQVFGWDDRNGLSVRALNVALREHKP